MASVRNEAEIWKVAVRLVVNTDKRQDLITYQSIQQALSTDGSIFSSSLDRELNNLHIFVGWAGEPVPREQ